MMPRKDGVIALLNGQHFSPDIHYIGLIGEDESINELLCDWGVANDLVFFEMNKNGHCSLRIST